jgi:hypothetical protein
MDSVSRSKTGQGKVVVVLAMVAAVVALMMFGATGAHAGECESSTGYKVCGPATPTGGAGGSSDTGSAVGSAVVQGGSTGDLPITGTSPTRTVVIGAAFILVGAAAVVGSLQARRRSGAAH